MFEIPVWDLLSSYSWDSKELEFEWEIPNWTFEEFEFNKKLKLRILIIWLDEWVSVIIKELNTTVTYKWALKFINKKDIERKFNLDKKVDDTDDIKYINKRWATIDLFDIIREEILIECESF